MSSLAGSMPPMSSTTRSGSVSSSAGRSALSSSGRIPGRSREASRTPTPVTTSRAPTRASRWSACSSSSRTTWAPTVPPPSTTTDNFSGGGAMTGLLGRFGTGPPPECAAGRVHRFSHGRRADRRADARAPDVPFPPRWGGLVSPVVSTQDGASASPASRANMSASVSRRSTIAVHAATHRHHRRARHHVVVRGHGPAVRARGGDGQQVAALEVRGQPGVADHDVPGLAVLADHAGQHRRGRGGARGQHDGVVRVVEGRADVVAHAAVDRHVGAPGTGPVLDVLDRAHLVEGDHARTDDRAARARRRSAARRSPAGRTPRRR